MNIATQRILFSFTLLAGLLLSALCIALPVLQWSGLANSVTVKYAIGSAALGLGICKLTFFPLAAWHLNQKNYLPAFVLFGIASIALMMSIIATASLLEGLINQKKQHAQTGNVGYTLQLNSINALDTQINNLNTLITHDINSNYRTRALQQQQSLNILMAKRKTLMTTLEQQKHSKHTLKTGLGGLWRFNLVNTAFAISGSQAAATALHVTGVLALLATTAWWPASVVSQHNKQAVQQVVASTPAVQSTPAIVNNLNADQNELAAKIVQGDFGQSPVLRNIINDKERGIRGGYKRVKPVIDYLLVAGWLQQNGRGYKLA